jgi:hypothetical protein
LERVRELLQFVKNKPYINISYETEDLKIKDLVDKGFTYQQAEDWLRKLYIDKMFNIIGMERDGEIYDDDVVGNYSSIHSIICCGMWMV